jgi:hypothetical protein
MLTLAARMTDRLADADYNEDISKGLLGLS